MPLPPPHTHIRRYRAQYGVALTLRKLGRYDEAVRAWEELQRLDIGWYGHSASYVNVFTVAPECIFRCVEGRGTVRGVMSTTWLNSQPHLQVRCTVHSVTTGSNRTVVTS